jgi:serine protease Do
LVVTRRVAAAPTHRKRHLTTPRRRLLFLQKPVSGVRAGTRDFLATHGPRVVHISAKHTGNPDGDSGDNRAGESLGSGFIISEDGYELTNNQFVDGTDIVTVELTDKRDFHARIIGTDKTFDVPVL